MQVNNLYPVVDTVVLRVMCFAHPQGIEILLKAVNAPCVYVPTEVYNCDEDSRPLEENDEGLSEFAQGLRYCQRQILSLPATESLQYQNWLNNAQQRIDHIAQRSVIIEALTIEELKQRERLKQTYPKCDRGEAACFVLARRYQGQAIFLSSDGGACKVAQKLEIRPRTLEDIVQVWVEQIQPTLADFDGMVKEMKRAKYRFKPDFVTQLRAKLS